LRFIAASRLLSFQSFSVFKETSGIPAFVRPSSFCDVQPSREVLNMQDTSLFTSGITGLRLPKVYHSAFVQFVAFRDVTTKIKPGVNPTDGTSMSCHYRLGIDFGPSQISERETASASLPITLAL
jgi:hypothetical protein